jgi:hypothetical protein
VLAWELESVLVLASRSAHSQRPHRRRQREPRRSH